MALDRKRLQQKKQKKSAKNKARKTQQPRGKFITGIFSKMAMRLALESPIYECKEPEGLFESGIGTVTVARRTEQNHILMSVFLLDVYCLGIKNTYIKMMDEDDYESVLQSIGRNERLKSIHPTCARKLVEEMVEYAEELGFSPHRDYKSTSKIFGDIDREMCPRSFEFGKDGKPYYFAGPYENERFSKQVVEKLMKKCGPDGFHYTFPLDGNPFLDEDENNEG